MSTNPGDGPSRPPLDAEAALERVNAVEADLLLSGAAEVVTLAGVGAGDVARAVAASVLTDASVAVRRGEIAWVGPAAEARAAVRLADHGEEIDCTGKVILPGLVDAHTHLPFAGQRAGEFRQRLAGESYEEINRTGGGILSTVRATRAASGDALRDGCRARMDRMLRFGVTTAEAKSGYGLSMEVELRQLEAIRDASAAHPVDLVPTLLAAHVVPPEARDDRSSYVDAIVADILPRVASEGLARYCDVFVDAGAYSLDEARRILKAARDLGLGVRVHADQLSPGGAAEMAAELGAASADHLEHVSEAGIRALARAGTVAVLVPAVNLFLRKSVFPPVRALLDAGVHVALATDCNPGSCMTENLPLCASLACMTTGLDTDSALAGITLQAARSLGLGESHGSIEPGKAADLAVFGVPERTTILYHFGIDHCRTVVKAGRVVLRDSRLSA